MNDRKKILVRGVNWIGDAVMTLPSFRVLRSEYSDSEIHILEKRWVAPVFGRDPNIDRFVEYKPEYSGVIGKLSASGDLRKGRYDSAFLFQNAFDAAILAYLSGIPERIGYNRDGRGFLLSRPIPVTAEAKRLHHVLYYLNLLREAGFKAVYRHPWIYMDTHERIKAAEVLEGLSRPIVILNPGATYGSAKRWPEESYASLSGMIIRMLGGSVVLTGSDAERGIADKILGMINQDLTTAERIRNLAGVTSLRALMSILSQADAVVSNDSGPMHLSYAVGTPLVSIFGSTDPALTGPPSYVRPGDNGFDTEIEFGLRDVVLKTDMDCSPCFERKCPRGDVLCLRRITPEEVFDALSQIVPTKRAVFFDRDGILCHDADYLNRMDDLKVFPEVKLLIKLKNKGFLLVGVSNQSGIARGIVEREFAESVNNLFLERYGFDAFYYCPHHPDDNCACRKPSPGMALRARSDLNIDLRSSIVVGDKGTDMELARNIGAEAILVRTGKDSNSDYADRVFNNLNEVVGYILEK
jgi:heptosyltransferase-2